MGRFGGLAFNLTGTYLTSWMTHAGAGHRPAPGAGYRVSDRTTASATTRPYASRRNREWRHRFRTSWQTPWDLDLSLTWRYYRGVTGLIGPNEEMPDDQLDRELPAEDYFDFAANWAITEKAAVTLGINNVLDDNPTLSGSVGTTGNGNTYPQTYDALGRYVFVRATVDF